MLVAQIGMAHSSVNVTLDFLVMVLSALTLMNVRSVFILVMLMQPVPISKDRFLADADQDSLVSKVSGVTGILALISTNVALVPITARRMQFAVILLGNMSASVFLDMKVTAKPVMMLTNVLLLLMSATMLYQTVSTLLVNMHAPVRLDSSVKTANVLISMSANPIDTTVMPMQLVKIPSEVLNAHVKMVSLEKVT